jgi:hypothetical protein
MSSSAEISRVAAADCSPGVRPGYSLRPSGARPSGPAISFAKLRRYFLPGADAAHIDMNKLAGVITDAASL